MEKELKCVICGKNFLGHGHNAVPVKIGFCCQKCNYEKVIPARIKRMKEVEIWED